MNYKAEVITSVPVIKSKRLAWVQTFELLMPKITGDESHPAQRLLPGEITPLQNELRKLLGNLKSRGT